MQVSHDTGTPSSAKGAARIEEPTRAERQLGRRAAESRATVPELELTAVVDMTATVQTLPELRGAPPDSAAALTAVVVRACALALREHPRANASYRDGHFELYPRINVGAALMADASFAVPTIVDADTKTAPEIADELRDLATSMEAGTITSPERAGATFTIANLGVIGVSSFSPPVTPPQAAVLAMGELRAVPVVRGADIVPGHEMQLTLTCDHRILYGTLAAAFLSRVRMLLESSQELMS